MKRYLPHFKSINITLVSLLLLFATHITPVLAQVTIVSDSSRLESKSTYMQHKIDSNASYQYDISDLFRNILHPKRERNPNKKRSGITLMPGVALNPTIGAQIGIKGVAGIVLGDKSNTTMSTAASTASVTTKGIMVFT
ncbi:hypothetical protein [Sphingobacterium sp. IITKGP-BTPF85]|uniref:hypothetical protein n=1 Tax=Sphingobacterium sp. IITKGP-BTPF85 TaxID=1338009 RepID=UPI00063397CD|nr:hypothetical protein [Sphingobacterium sp. IITKGP-BTPF85]KKX49226.1 hypothetical protein L950_0216805 [Sphingobacterium sp. IITKGP-BTPF85]